VPPSKEAFEPLELAFYAISAGAILYVIGEVWNGMRRYGYRELGLSLLAFGFIVGVATDMVFTADERRELAAMHAAGIREVLRLAQRTIGPR